MNHPYSERTKDEIISMAKVYLPQDGTDWESICYEVISWLTDRAKENAHGNGDWFLWMSCDPVHIASRAVENKGHEYFAGTQAGWCNLLFVLNRRRYEQYIAKKKIKSLGGAG